MHKREIPIYEVELRENLKLKIKKAMEEEIMFTKVYTSINNSIPTRTIRLFITDYNSPRLSQKTITLGIDLCGIIKIKCSNRFRDIPVISIENKTFIQCEEYALELSQNQIALYRDHMFNVIDGKAIPVKTIQLPFKVT